MSFFLTKNTYHLDKNIHLAITEINDNDALHYGKELYDRFIVYINLDITNIDAINTNFVFPFIAERKLNTDEINKYTVLYSSDDAKRFLTRQFFVILVIKTNNYQRYI